MRTVNLILFLFLSACATTEVDRFDQTLSITAAATVATDDGLYAYAKAEAASIAAAAKTEAEGLSAIAALEKKVAAVRAALAVVKGLIVTGLSIAQLVRSGAPFAALSSWLPTLWAAVDEVNKVLAALGAAGVPKLPTLTPTGGP